MSIENTYDFLEEMNMKVERFINKNMKQISAKDIGLDPRAGYTLYINEDAVACPRHNAGTFDYYGGAEYVDKEYRQQMGDYVFYFREDNRVDGWILNYEAGEAE